MNSLIARLDDWLNPILVKELRQTVRSKAFWWIYLLFLAIISIVFISFTAHSTESERYGLEIIEYMFNTLFFVSFGLVPLQVARQVISEQSDATNELLQITTIEPRTIVMGKYLCGASLVLMLYSAFVPFMFLTLFIGGIDLGNLFVALTFSFIISQIAILGAIADGHIIGNSGSMKQGGIGFSLVIFIGVWFLCQNVCSGFFSGANLYPGLRDEPSFVIAIAIIFALIMFTLFHFNVALKKPESSNKMYSFRKRAAIAWLISLAIPIIRPSFGEFWVVAAIIVIAIASLAAHGEPDTYSKRVVNEIPDSLGRKILEFPLFYGMTNAFAWIFLATLLTLIFINLSSLGIYDKDSFSQCIISLFIYVHAYGFWGNLVRRIFFKRSGKMASVGLAFALFLGFGVLVPFIVRDLISGYRSADSPLYYFAVFFNPLLGRGSLESRFVWLFISGSLFLLGGLLFNASILRKQLRLYFNKESEDWDEEAYLE